MNLLVIILSTFAAMKGSYSYDMIVTGNLVGGTGAAVQVLATNIIEHEKGESISDYCNNDTRCKDPLVLTGFNTYTIFVPMESGVWIVNLKVIHQSVQILHSITVRNLDSCRTLSTVKNKGSPVSVLCTIGNTLYLYSLLLNNSDIEESLSPDPPTALAVLPLNHLMAMSNIIHCKRLNEIYFFIGTTRYRVDVVSKTVHVNETTNMNECDYVRSLISDEISCTRAYIYCNNNIVYLYDFIMDDIDEIYNNLHYPCPMETSYFNLSHDKEVLFYHNRSSNITFQKALSTSAYDSGTCYGQSIFVYTDATEGAFIVRNQGLSLSKISSCLNPFCNRIWSVRNNNEIFIYNRDDQTASVFNSSGYLHKEFATNIDITMVTPIIIVILITFSPITYVVIFVNATGPFITDAPASADISVLIGCIVGSILLLLIVSLAVILPYYHYKHKAVVSNSNTTPSSLELGQSQQGTIKDVPKATSPKTETEFLLENESTESPTETTTMEDKGPECPPEVIDATKPKLYEAPATPPRTAKPSLPPNL